MDRTAADLEANIDEAAEQTQAVIGAVGERVEGAIDDAPRQTASVVQSVRLMPRSTGQRVHTPVRAVHARYSLPIVLQTGDIGDATRHTASIVSLISSACPLHLPPWGAAPPASA